ncbi:peptidoglycan DD-metalloendopeptidase family protein [Desulfovibrio sp. OttesenSCG-928-O18]|nr:peptidoglycan DD-metalloendopeptidase family protein [Desulfovibrio sp. OttesenSCG-928-O18]
MRAYCLAFCCLMVLCAWLPFPEAHAAARRASSPASVASGIEAQIAQEQARAKARRDSLSRLTTEERGLDKELATSEARILYLESSLAKEEKTLENLAATDAELEEKGKVLLAEQIKTEEAMTEVLRVLWELHARREGVKGRDLPDWPMTDREHTWSVELFSSLDAYRKTLAEQQKDMEAVIEKRASIAKEVQQRITALNREKEELLQSRIRYGQRLAALRKEKVDTEKELTTILSLVQNLNLRLQAAEAEGDIGKAKGRLPWPVTGKMRGKYNPSANPPVRGVTFGLDGDTPVHAVHWGKVVHNDVLRGIGRVVIVMHGEEYYSLYAFLSESPLRVGQNVARGEVVGTSGFVTSLNGPGLYFELRYHQKAVNPEEWLRK